MRSLLAACCAVLSLVSWAAPPPGHNPPDLRRVLGQLPAAGTPPPRQLDAEQRAELRRQLREFRAARRRGP